MKKSGPFQTFKEMLLCLLILVGIRMLAIYSKVTIIGVPIIDEPLGRVVDWLTKLPFAAYLRQFLDLFSGF